jgi:type VI protein secretion system component VasK
MRESYSALFTIAIASILSVLVVVGEPLFKSFTWYSWEVVLSRLLVALPLILLLVAISVFLIRMMKKIDDAADKKREVSTKTAFKEALKEDRDEQRKKDIYEDKY